MKSLLIAAICTVLAAPAISQRLSKITIGDNGNLELMAFEMEPNVLMVVSETGNVIRWGEDIYVQNGVENFETKLRDYMGRVEYYAATDNEAFRGKLKYLGRLLLTYYASYEDESLRGKLKSIGSVTLNYYQNFENEAYRGKLKSIGGSDVTWYSNFDNAAYKGKLKSIGAAEITGESPDSQAGFQQILLAFQA